VPTKVWFVLSALEHKTLVQLYSRYYYCYSSQRECIWPTFGAFAVAGPTAWNSLSNDLRDRTLSTDSFRHLLKTRLFTEY